MTVKELHEKRQKLIADARAIMANVENENRELTGEESARFDALMADAEKAKGDMERHQALEGAESELEQRSRSAGRKTAGAEVATRNSSADALRGFLLTGSTATPSEAEQRAMHDAGVTGNVLTFKLAKDAIRSGETVQDFERRALSHTDAEGGYLVPEGFSGELEIAMKQFGGIRQMARVIRTNSGNPLPWPTSDDTSNIGALIAENTEITEQDVAFGAKNLGAYKFSSKIVRVPIELLQDSGVDLGATIGRMLGERLGRAQNKYYTTGAGPAGTPAQPSGIVTGATSAFTADAATAITYDELVDLEHSVDAAYRTNAKFMLNDSTLAALKKLKDSDNKPIWLSGLTAGAPDTILGYQYVINNDVDGMAAGKKSVLFGAADKHLIRDVRDVMIMRLNERYAEYGQVAFVAFYRGDSVLLDAGTHPVKYITMAAA